MMHKTCSINYGHLADLQKTLPTTDLNKKNFHLIKYLLATFIFFPFFSICIYMDHGNGMFKFFIIMCARWCHQTKTFSVLLAIRTGNSPVTGEFPAQRSLRRTFDVFLDLRLNKRWSKESWGWWIETPSRPLLRHCNGFPLDCYQRAWCWNSSAVHVWGPVARK